MPRNILETLHREWPTCVTLVCFHASWIFILQWHQPVGVLWIPLTVLLVTLHSSLQHEALHGHPTKNRVFNEVLVGLAPGLFIPYRRFRDMHLKHHRNEKLTDPHDDPETWYLAEVDWQRRSALMKMALNANATLAGRMVIGPALSLYAFWKEDLRAILRGDRNVTTAWFMHFVGVTPVVWFLKLCQIELWFYALAVAYPAMSVLLVRSFVEHRASEQVKHRTAVVEAGSLMSLLFLNNNLHAVHHKYPTVPWHELPALWSEQKEQVIAENDHYHFPGGYLSVAKQWLFKRREPVVHPILRKNKPAVPSFNKYC